MKYLSSSLLLMCVMALPTWAFAQDPNWNQHIAPILYNHCASCHHSGGIGPFPLLTYAQTTGSAAAILDAVSAKRMPPWKADPAYRHLKGENVLTSAQKAKIQQWINLGMPEGPPNTAPPVPNFPSGSSLHVVDKTVYTGHFQITSPIDQYRTFVIPGDSIKANFLNKIEFVPGNQAVVHHIILFCDSTNFSRNLDQQDATPGFASNGLSQPSQAAQYLCVWAPGAGVYELPSNMGIRVPKNADYLVEIHYAPGSQFQWDSTTVNLQFTQGPSVRRVFVEPVMDWVGSLLNGPLYIPANTTRSFTQRFVNNIQNFSVISVFPHMHRVGTSYKVWASPTANPSDSIPFLYIPKWSFHWQGFYTFQHIQKFSTGQTLWGKATFDNTVNNPDNPSSPPINVVAGEHTTDEMMVVFLAYANYQPGDENILLDSTLLSGIGPRAGEEMAANVYPNPSDESGVWLSNITEAGNWQLLDFQGKVLEQGRVTAGTNRLVFSDVPPGIYFLRITQSNQTQTIKWIRSAQSVKSD